MDLAKRINLSLVLNALYMALNSRKPQPGVLHHTVSMDRNKLISSGLIASMSRKGDCYDNAVAESFFSTLKHELIYGQKFMSRDQARSEIIKYIEIFYNRQRLHQALDYVAPETMELKVSHN